MLTLSQQLSKNHVFTDIEPLVLECGQVLQNLRIQYTTIGELNKDKSNVIWVFHALTGNSNPAEWWPGIVGEEDFFNPSEHFIICANVIGSCYGSTEPETLDFPLITVRDMVKAHIRLKDFLEIERIKVGIGGSLGGQQLLQWAVLEPLLFESIIPIATNAKHSAWGIAFNEAQRMAIEAAKDKNQGLEAARAIAMLSYRNSDTYNQTQTDRTSQIDDFSASSYQRYQGSKLSKRFSPYSYYTLSKAMDSHNLASKGQEIKDALAEIRAKTIVIGVESDLLFPIEEQRLLFETIPNAVFYPIQSLYGHDGFLVETKQLTQILKKELS